MKVSRYLRDIQDFLNNVRMIRIQFVHAPYLQIAKGILGVQNYEGQDHKSNTAYFIGYSENGKEHKLGYVLEEDGKVKDFKEYNERFRTLRVIEDNSEACFVCTMDPCVPICVPRRETLDYFGIS